MTATNTRANKSIITFLDPLITLRLNLLETKCEILVPKFRQR